MTTNSGEAQTALLEALRAATGGPFETARTMPAAIYSSGELYQRERARLFEHSWICVGRAAEIASPGDYFCFELLDTPVLLVRQTDGQISGFLNVCAHRAARLVDGCGSARRFVCPYHAWTYQLDGRLSGARFMDQTPGFDVRGHRLTPIRTEVWQGFIYATLDADITPVRERLAAFDELISRYRIADYRHSFSVEERWPANWKCFVENYMDAYHLFKVHNNTFGQSGHYEGLTRLFDGDDHYTYHLVDGRDGDASGLAHPNNTWLDEDFRKTTVLGCVFPSHTLQLQPDMLWSVSVLPDSIDSFKMRWTLCVPEEVLADQSDTDSYLEERRAFLSAVNAEDHAVVEQAYQGLRCNSSMRGPYSWLERNVYRFGQYLARELCD